MSDKKKMMVVCHDAGGAEVISAFVGGHSDAYEYKVFVGGPAGDIFARKEIDAIWVSDDDQRWTNDFFVKQHVDILLTNIGWSSTIELNALQAAKKRSVHTIVYLDHWVNYRERFGYPRQEWGKDLPNEFWAGDKYSFELAKTLFPGIVVRLEPNLYFEEVRKDFRRYLAENKNGSVPDSLLFISEPISAADRVLGTGHVTDERRILESLLGALAAVNFGRKILIRLHPAEVSEKFDDLLATYRGNLQIEKSLRKSIYEDLARSFIVVGMESMALVVASLCGKRVVSLLLDCSLPFPKIQKVRDAKQLAALVSRPQK